MLWTMMNVCRGIWRRRRHLLHLKQLSIVVLTIGLIYGLSCLMLNESLGRISPRREELTKTSMIKVGEVILQNRSSKMASTAVTGFERARHLRDVCHNLQTIRHLSFSLYIANRITVNYNERYNVLFCPMCKMASSFWTRALQMMRLNSENNETVAKTPYDIALKDAPPSKQLYDIQKKRVNLHNDVTSAFKFVFVRSPYSKLFSAYVDKLVGPNPTMWDMLGKNAILHARGVRRKTCYHDVTFEEYVNYAIHVHLSRTKSDCHFSKFTECSLCRANYSFVGKMESFKEDVFTILSVLNQTKTIEIFNTELSYLHAMDAIEDSISSPFAWKSTITKCISWPNALRRVWRKLQIRGVLGATRFPLSDQEADAVDKATFIELANKARQQSSSSEKKTMKREAFTEAYSTMSEIQLSKLAIVFKEELKMFEYKSLDFEVIQRQAAENTYNGYFDYSKEITVV